MSEEFVIVEKEDLTAIANAVRGTIGSTEDFNVPELRVATIDALSAGGGTLTTHIEDKNNPHEVTAEQIGAEVSGAASTALNEAKAYTDEKLGQISFDAPTPDWNAPDGAAGHILNRTHYVEESAFLEETAYKANNSIRTPSALVIGETYNVYWNGTKYECVCYEGSDLEDYSVPSLAGSGPNGDESYPFMVAYLNRGVAVICDSVPTGTVAITIQGNVHKLDPKFLPESLENWMNASPTDFAPSGYGYGGGVPYVTVSDYQDEASYNTALDDLLSGMPAGVAKQIRIPYIDGTTMLGTVFNHYDGYATVVCYGYGSFGFIARKTKYNSIWSNWEWVNPPMQVGVEYRTTERWQGNPVYVKLIDAGTLPNSSTKYVESAIVNGITKVVDVKLNMYSGSGMAQRTNDSRIIVTVNVESPYAWLEITANENFSTYTGQVVVKYIK